MQNGRQTINIYSIFKSINGEICKSGQGSWATFIRFAGCDLKCTYCDTEYAQDVNSGKKMTIDEIVQKVANLRCSNITITGGEPLAQRSGVNKLIRVLLSRNYHVSIETNGSYPVISDFNFASRVPADVSWVVDYKLPSSGAFQHMANIKPWSQLTNRDYIKFVIDTSTRRDYDVALSKMQQFWGEGVRAQMVFSPILGTQIKTTARAVNTLYTWMQENQLFSVLLNIQLHKVIKLKEPN